MRICGIDPGLRHTGWGVIEVHGNQLSWVADGVISPDSKRSDEERLLHIYAELKKVLTEHKPDSAGIEEVFMAKNAASALKLGMARGAAMVALAEFGLKVEAISARRVKQNVTGSGRADKQQVKMMVKHLLGQEPCGVDSADALAIAIAASHQFGEIGAQVTNTGLSAAIERALEKEEGTA